MKTKNTLPPELVEKMRIAMNEMCTPRDLAKIAVEHSDGYRIIAENAFKENDKLKQQRDELLENTRVDNLFLDKWIRLFHMANCHAEILEEMKDMLHQNQQLLKKHEDGKE